MPTDRPRSRRLRRLLERDSSARGEEPAGEPARPDGHGDRIRALREEIERIAARRGGAAGAPTSGPEDPHAGQVEADGAPPLPGELVRTPHGETWVRDRTYEAGSLQGAAPVMTGQGLTGRTASLLALDGALTRFEIGRATFLDIETTGLSMGTGTIAFLVGLGWYAEGAFHVRQLFVDRLENEPAVLHSLVEMVGRRPFLVTFNGKTFDVPVLRARLGLNRLSADLDREGHLDLLHAARRLYKRRIGDCSLDSCERAVLGFHREGDIPGELIPEIFTSYLRTGRPGRMHDVFHHNLLDVVSMAALVGCMTDLVSGQEEADMDDVMSLARVRMRHGDEEDAERIFGLATASGSAEHRIESNLELAIMARRRGEHDLARSLLESILEDDPDHAASHLMLAKLYEHRLRRYGQALEHARLAEEAEGTEASLHRIERLLRRLAGSDGSRRR